MWHANNLWFWSYVIAKCQKLSYTSTTWFLRIYILRNQFKVPIFDTYSDIKFFVCRFPNVNIFSEISFRCKFFNTFPKIKFSFSHFLMSFWGIILRSKFLTLNHITNFYYQIFPHNSWVSVFSRISIRSQFLNFYFQMSLYLRPTYLELLFL